MPEVHNNDSWQVLIAILWPFAQQFLKNWEQFPWLTKATKVENHVVSMVVALASTLGLHYGMSGTAAAGWTFTMVIPPVVALQHVAAQWLTQHLVYQGAIKVPDALQQIIVLLTPSTQVVSASSVVEKDVKA